VFPLDVFAIATVFFPFQHGTSEFPLTPVHPINTVTFILAELANGRTLLGFVIQRFLPLLKTDGDTWLRHFVVCVLVTCCNLLYEILFPNSTRFTSIFH
jgi:hypothetical protein